MKKIIYTLIVTSVLFITSCNKYVDIMPKGKSLLNTVVDLDLMMNVLSAPTWNYEDLCVLVNDHYPVATNLPNAIALPPAAQNYLLTYNTAARNVQLSDGKFERAYARIINMNYMINLLDGATGDAVKKKQLKAEGRIMRAYYHYILVNIYAKSYNPATAATDGGISYVTDYDLNAVNPKITVAEVYRHILQDVNDAVEDLPTTGTTIMRPGKAFGYALQSRVLLQMRDYAGALTAANNSLAINSFLEDHASFINATHTGLATRTNNAGNNLMYAYYIAARPNTLAPSIEVYRDVYEPGNIIKFYTATYKTSAPYGVVNNSPSGNNNIYAWTSSTYLQNSGGLNTEDAYLYKAEAQAKTNDFAGAMNTINAIRIKRIKASDYVAAVAANEAQAMAVIMRTARIEHLYTWKNFVDVKRWNTFEDYKQTITRTINASTFTLQPESPLWIFPFPISALYNATLTQNTTVN